MQIPWVAASESVLLKITRTTLNSLDTVKVLQKALDDITFKVSTIDAKQYQGIIQPEEGAMEQRVCKDGAPVRATTIDLSIRRW